MGAVWMRVRAEARQRWRAWVGLALLIGLAGGVATAAAAGARRSESAYPRFVESHDGAHVVTGGLGEGEPEEIARKQQAIASLPQVESYSLSQFVSDRFLLPSGAEVSFPEAFVSGDATGAEGVTINRVKVLRGRMFRASASDEAVTDFGSAERFGLSVGDRLVILLPDPATFEPTVRRPVTIVGIVVVPGVLPAVGQTPLGGLLVAPGFLQANADNLYPNEDAPTVRLKGGSAGIEEFVAAARAIAPTVDVPVTLPRHLEGVRKTLRFDVAALWILAGLVGAASLIILGQALARQIGLEAEEHGVLRALGYGRGQLIAADVLRAGAIGLAGAVIAVAIGLGISPMFPRGLAKLVEPDPGFSADWLVLGVGAGATLALAVLVSVVPSVRAARARASAGVSRPSVIAAALAGAGGGPSVVAGARLALERGRGARTVPVRATIAGVAVAVAAFTAAGSFTDSLDALISRPELYGFGWDVFGGSDDVEADAAHHRADPDVEAFTPGGYANVVIAGRQLIPMVYEPGGIEPTILEGKVPRDDDEIALGTGLLRSLGLSIGDTVMVAPAEADDPAAKAQPLTIVGRTVVPPIFFQQVEPGESVAMTLEAAFRIAPDEREGEGEIPFLIRYKDGVDVRAKVNELRKDLPGFFVGQVRAPGAELSALSRSSDLPLILTLVLLVMAVGTLIHTLVSSIRRRRHDLAILKTLGFLRGQVRAAVSWQATLLVVFALVIGLPLGLALGRWSWRWFANTLGVVPDPVESLLLVLVVVPVGAISLSNVIAGIPGRAAARTHPAAVLRSE